MDHLQSHGPRGCHLETLLRDPEETEAFLSRQIQQEETRAGAGNLVDPAYPLAAWRLRARRDNFLASIETVRRYQRSIVAGTDT